jgi:phage FluMu gp28-like protein
LDPSSVLRGSGRTEANARVCRQLAKALPEREARAVLSWLSAFFGYQQTWILDPHRFSALVKCRQIGGSHAYAAAAVFWGLFAESTSIVSIGERESAEVLKKVVKHAKVLVHLGSEWARPIAVSVTRATLASGGVITAMPSETGARGQSGNVLLDEAAYYEHPEEVWDGASATVFHGYRMRVISTPNGVGNLFHSLVTGDAGKGYMIHQTTLDEARADGLKIDDETCWKMARGDPRLYAQLFQCSFLDAELQYIPTEYIDACSGEIATGDGDHYAGLDIGRDADRTVLIVVREHLGVRLVVHIEEMKRTDSDGLEAMVDRAFARFKLRRLCIDATGLGTFPAERIAKKHSERIETKWRRPRVEQVTFTPSITVADAPSQTSSGCS